MAKTRESIRSEIRNTIDNYGSDVLDIHEGKIVCKGSNTDMSEDRDEPLQGISGNVGTLQEAFDALKEISNLNKDSNQFHTFAHHVAGSNTDMSEDRDEPSQGISGNVGTLQEAFDALKEISNLNKDSNQFHTFAHHVAVQNLEPKQRLEPVPHICTSCGCAVGATSTGERSCVAVRYSKPHHQNATEGAQGAEVSGDCRFYGSPTSGRVFLLKLNNSDTIVFGDVLDTIVLCEVDNLPCDNLTCSGINFTALTFNVEEAQCVDEDGPTTNGSAEYTSEWIESTVENFLENCFFLIPA
ncbi:hypothetical protein C0J52_19456 [Blattella germanica]|nr:hypothetical protein C0J52_19456 [Blattella germanica]